MKTKKGHSLRNLTLNHPPPHLPLPPLLLLPSHRPRTQAHPSLAVLSRYQHRPSGSHEGIRIQPILPPQRPHRNAISQRQRRHRILGRVDEVQHVLHRLLCFGGGCVRGWWLVVVVVVVDARRRRRWWRVRRRISDALRDRRWCRRRGGDLAVGAVAVESSVFGPASSADSSIAALEAAVVVDGLFVVGQVLVWWWDYVFE